MTQTSPDASPKTFTERSLRVCHLMFPGHMGGAEKVVLAGCEALCKLGHDIELAVVREARMPSNPDAFIAEARERNIPLHTELTANKRIDVSLFRQLREYLHTQRFDVIHTHGYKALLYASRARRRETTLVHTHHGDTSRGMLVCVYQFLAYRQMKRVDAVCAVSEEMRQQFLKRGFSANHVRLIENMLATPINDDGPRRKRLATVGERLHLVSVGRLSVEKGLLVLLEAIAGMSGPRPHLTLVGVGPQESELRDAVKANQLVADVSFAGFCKDVLPHLMNADAFVMPSYREGFPISLIEAAAAGLPVIATNVGGIPCLVTSGENGLLCPPHDVAAYRQCLQTFCDDPAKFQSAARELAPQVRERFSPETWAAETLALYRSL